MSKQITSNNLPNLGVEPYKRFDKAEKLVYASYSFFNGSILSIDFDMNGAAELILYNGYKIPNNSELEVCDGNLYIKIPAV